MAEVAGGAGCLFAMAIHAGSHGDADLFGEQVALLDRAMAGFAGEVGVEVHAMAEGDIAGDLIDTHPGDGLAIAGVGGEALDGWLLFGDFDMARHTFGRGGEAGDFTGVGIGVAVLAGEAGGDVLFVAEGEGLFGGGGLGWEEGCG